MSQRDHSFLAGGGEMGELMRVRDWASTPLHEPAHWPQSLRTSVSTCLNCAFPILLWWGRELVMLYNDEYIPMLGAKHPSALGQAGAACWPEIWDVIGPMLRQVLERGEPTRSRDLLLTLERKGFPEECYFSFSYSPIRDETGDVGGVFTPVIETTAKVIGERRLKTLRDLASHSAAMLDVDETVRQSAAVLAQNPHDVAFSALYILRPDRRSAERQAFVGFADPCATFPAEVELGTSSLAWIDQAISALDGQPQIVEGLSSQLTPGDLPANPWPETPDRAIALPIVLAGEELPSAILIAGLSPRLEFDQGYREFLELVGRQIGTRISDALAYEAERRRAEALAEIDRAKTAFFSNVSHEFRTPLTLMLGPLEEALNEPDGSSPLVRQRLEIAHRNSLRLLKLVNTLLDFSRIEAGRIQARFEATDLSALTADLVSSFRSAFDKAGLFLKTDCPPLPLPIHVDRDMWEKVVLNLVSNAFKFTFEGGVEVNLHSDGDRAALTIRDTGVGIPKEELPRLFERFHRIEGQRSRSFEGSGIGLALVHELVRQHGGAIDVKSRVGSGTSFTVTIPFGTEHLPLDRVGVSSPAPTAQIRASAFVEEALRWLPDSNTSDEGSLEIAAAAGGAAKSRPRVLLADDNADVRAYLTRILKDAYEVSTAANGREALEAIRRLQPDLLLSDVMMPDLDGIGLVRELRSDPSFRDLPVILLSARAGEEARVESLEAGADAYLIKPFSARELVAHVGANLALARLRREAAQAALDSAERLKRLFEQAPAFMCTLRGPNHVFEIANEAYRKLIGRRDIIGLPVREAVPEAEGQGFFERLDQVYATGVAFTARRAPIRLAAGEDGELQDRFLDFVYQPITESDGTVSGIFVEGVDVTDHIEAEAALRASETRQRTLIETLPQLVWTCLPDGRCDYLSPQWVAYTGASDLEHLGLDWLKVVHPDDRDRTLEHWMGAVANRHPYDIEFRIRRHDGAYRWFKARAAPVRDDGGAITYWFGSNTDIQEIVEARDVLKRSKEDLEREIEERTHERDRLWRNSRDLLVVVGADGVFQAANPAWSTILGWSPEEVVGHNHLDFVLPDDQPSSQGALDHALAAPLPSYENRVRHKDGGFRWISWVAASEAGLVYASGRHITAEKEAAAELAKAHDALRQSQKMEAIGQLTGGVAHDFNNLLTVIRSSADLLGRRDLADDRRRRYLDAISDTVDRAAKLTSQLLAFSRRQPLSPRVFDLAESLESVTDMLDSVLGSRITLELDIVDRPALVEADVNQFETALVNLAANARDAMDGEGRLTIRLKAVGGGLAGDDRNRSFAVSVSDTGCGIPQDHLGEFFEPFFTTKDVGRGTGLGLSQVYGFASQSGGRVKVESKVGQGTTFELILPRSDKALEGVREALGDVASTCGGEGCVLVVEDNRDVGEFSTQLLDDLGYRTMLAIDAKSALSLIQENPDRFDLVFSDVVMPGMNGIDLGKEVRRRWPHFDLF